MPNEQMELYKQFQAQYCNMLSAASEAYNKSILGLSTTIIGFSFAILRFTINAIRNLCELRMCWISLTVTIFLILVSFIATQKHAQHRIRFINSIIDGKSDVPYQDMSDWIMYWSALWAGITFFVGIVYFAVFCWANIMVR